MPKEIINVCLLQNNIRAADNLPLYEASKNRKVMPIYIIDRNDPCGEASRIFSKQALLSVNEDMDGSIRIFRSSIDEAFTTIQSVYDIEGIFTEAPQLEHEFVRHSELSELGRTRNIKIHKFNTRHLWVPGSIKIRSDSNIPSFTQYFRNGCLKSTPPRKPIPRPDKIEYVSLKETKLNVDHISEKRNWHGPLLDNWTISENAAHSILDDFVAHRLSHYKSKRDFPASGYVSMLSPYIKAGLISINTIWHAVTAGKLALDKNACHFRSELGWREFSYHLALHFPNIETKPMRLSYQSYPWEENESCLINWQKGLTGYPMVDAGMRQLYQTGYMHNRLRMITGSFLVKNLRLHWVNGAKWFNNCLLDADYAVNNASWQWVAGTGADQQQYSRIFNPVIQAQKFDPEGEYIRAYLPSLKKLPNKFLFAPWTAPKKVLEDAGVHLGVNYPNPIVDFQTSSAINRRIFAELISK